MPEVYSAELSEFVFAAGVKLLKEWSPDVMYLSTTDYIQHKFAPEEQGALDFHAMVDGYLGQLDELGATLVLTADHGMKPKHDSDGDPAVVYVQDLLDDLGAAAARVIHIDLYCSSWRVFATVYLPDSVNAVDIADRLAAVDGIMMVIDWRSVMRFGYP